MSQSAFPDLVQPPKPEFQYLSDEIGKRFKVHHIEGDSIQYAFFLRELADGTAITNESDAVDAAFESLRVELKKYSYVPTLHRVGSHMVLTVVRIPDPPFRSGRVNWMMFLATLASVQWAGAFLWAAYIGSPGADGFTTQVAVESAEAMSGGFLYFTLPLLSILGLHEMGHFVVARHYRVRASLPFFIPSIPPLGTFGAFISMRDPLPSRRAIFDIGISGPMVGFVAACVVTVAGVFLTQSTPQAVRPETGGGWYIGTPIIYGFLNSAFGLPESYLHPTSFAGWAGFLVTAFNLIPAAQLDGGHVFYSMIPNRPRRAVIGVAVSFFAVVAIAGWGVLAGYVGWVLLLIIVLVTIRHPPALNQISKLGWARIFAGAVAILVFVVSFVPAPVSIVDADYGFTVAKDTIPVEVPAGGFANASIDLTNTGNTYNLIEAEAVNSVGNYNATFGGGLNRTQILLNKLEYENRTLNLTIAATDRALPSSGVVWVVLRAVDDPTVVHSVQIPVHSVTPHPGLQVEGPNGTIFQAATRTAAVPIELTNTGDVPLNLSLSALNISGDGENWQLGFTRVGNITASVSVLPAASSNVTVVVVVPYGATDGQNITLVIGVSTEYWPALGAPVTLVVEARAS